MDGDGIMEMGNGGKEDLCEESRRSSQLRFGGECPYELEKWGQKISVYKDYVVVVYASKCLSPHC